MLPRGDRQQRHGALPMVALMVVDLLDDDPAARGIPGSERPSRTLNRGGRLGHVALEALEAAEVGGELGGHLTGRLTSAVGRQVLPEQRVQHVARQVEGQVLLQLADRTEVVAGAGVGQLLESGIRSLHVRGVVLVVMQLHDLAADMRLQPAVVVVEIGQSVDLVRHAVRSTRPG